MLNCCCGWNFEASSHFFYIKTSCFLTCETVFRFICTCIRTTIKMNLKTLCRDFFFLFLPWSLSDLSQIEELILVDAHYLSLSLTCMRLHKIEANTRPLCFHPFIISFKHAERKWQHLISRGGRLLYRDFYFISPIYKILHKLIP